MNRRLAGCLATVAGCALIALAGWWAEPKKSEILGNDGKVIGEIRFQDGQLTFQCEDRLNGYVSYVCDELIREVMEREGVEQEEALRRVSRWAVRVETAFSEEVMEEVRTAIEGNPAMRMGESAVAVSDLEGNLLACDGNSTDGSVTNYIEMSSFAGSSIKPLSVYAPALERNLICWSSLYKDTPFAFIEDEDGRKKEWPATSDYTGRYLTVADAVKVSNNTVAVKVLKDYGAEKSAGFLKENLGIAIDKELEIIKEQGEDKALSALGLGYLKDGVTVAQMTEAYQIFANSGVYHPLHSILRIEKNGRDYYAYEDNEKRVLSEDTAYVMNRMLKGVVDSGTGKAASLEGIEVCGKTGTSDERDHWFVGVTTDYVCGVWYKPEQDELGTEESVRVYHDIVGRLKHGEKTQFSAPESVVERKFCKKTGKLAGEGCTGTETGYYRRSGVPMECTECNP